ncbi:MAG: TonB-dependent receptor [Melioribacteraceae bacterium]|jgi:outer membrane receptor for ferrienterochelin and colicins|nr:TonB-dependent receptor [Melioribacteraceae bacterium]
MQIILLLFLFCVSAINAQNLNGIIYENSENGKTTPLPGVNIFWANTQFGTTSDGDGKFSLVKTGDNFTQLIISHITYEPDTIMVKKEDGFIELQLTQNREFNDVLVTAKTTGITIKEFETIHTEELGRKELLKAACCNLSESFETNPSVDVSYSDAVTGIKQIKLLGLSGKYSQMMTENIPNMGGLASTLGFYFIPGAWMHSIQISKGSATVINGSETMTGQINVELKKPADEKLYLDIYANSIFKTDLNGIFSFNLSEHISTNLMLHGEYFGRSIDDNNDSFLDHPNVKQFNILNRWKYADQTNWNAQITFNYISDERAGGQVGFVSGTSIPNPYKTVINTERFQVWSKLAYIFGNNSNTNIGFINMYTYHNQKSLFGIRTFNAKENSFYSNLIFESNLFNVDHKFNAGASFTYAQYDETFINSNEINDEIVQGIFTQYTYSPSQSLSMIAGLRADFHNEFGAFFTPRLHFRYSPIENTTLRFSIGKGYRTAKIISENISLLASSREFIFHENLNQEEAVNIGINLTQYYTIFDREIRIGLEFYRTEFINKVVIDIDKNSHEVNFYNLVGNAYSNTYQFELGYELIPDLDFLGAIRFNDVKINYSGKLMSDPLNKELKGIVTLSYLSKLKLWQFDFTTQFNGKSRIPNRVANEYSPSYTILIAQIKRIFEDWEIFVGAENITDYKQDNPIIDASNPFGPDFDATIIWAPTIGRMFYVGARYSIK